MASGAIGTGEAGGAGTEEAARGPAAAPGWARAAADAACALAAVRLTARFLGEAPPGGWRPAVVGAARCFCGGERGAGPKELAPQDTGGASDYFLSVENASSAEGAPPRSARAVCRLAFSAVAVSSGAGVRQSSAMAAAACVRGCRSVGTRVPASPTDTPDPPNPFLRLLCTLCLAPRARVPRLCVEPDTAGSGRSARVPCGARVWRW